MRKTLGQELVSAVNNALRSQIKGRIVRPKNKVQVKTHKPTKSILETVHESAKGLFDAGLMDAKTMHNFDVMCLSLDITGRILQGGVMSRYIKAEQGPNHCVIYTDNTGRYFRFSGGSWAWRNNNPGNCRPGNVSKRNFQIGTAGGFAVFPDKETGHRALVDSLRTTYKNASIDSLVKTYAPASDGNNVKKYSKFLHDKTGVKDDKKVKDFTAQEFDKLWQAIEQIEGYKVGVVVEVFQITQVHKSNGAIYDYNVNKIGWVSKSECMNLAKQGKLDLIVCTSRLGHNYVRARVGSSINKSLNDLVIKNPDKKK